MEVWIDGNGFGYYAYVTDSWQGTIGRLELVFRNRGRTALCAEAQALLTALECVDAHEIRIHVDSSSVLGIVATPEFLKRPSHQFVKPIMEKALKLMATKNVQLKWVHGHNNRAHELLIPYSRGRGTPPPETQTQAAKNGDGAIARSTSVKLP